MTDYGRTNLVMQIGTDWTRTFTYLQADGVTPVNLTGCHARMQVRASASATTKILDLDDQLKGGITMGGTAGTITVMIPNSKLTLIADGGTLDLSSVTGNPQTILESFDNGTTMRGVGLSGVFDLELVDTLSAVTRLLQGQVVFDPEVTR